MSKTYDLVIERDGEKYVALNGLLAAAIMPNYILDASTLMKVGFDKGEGMASILQHVLAGFALGVAGEVPSDPWKPEEMTKLMTQLKKPACEAGDRELIDLLQRKHRSAMLVGFVALLPQAPESDFRAILREAFGKEGV